MAVPANVKYYEYLKSKKLDVPPTYDSFQKTLSDKEKAMKYYSYLSSKKSQGMDVDIPASFDSFYNTLNPKGASSEVGAASGEDLNAPQQPSAPSFTGAKGMKPRGIQPALKQEAEKPRPTKPYQDIMPKMEEAPSETTQAAVPAPISFAEQEQEKANESIRRGYLPSNPAIVNDRVISEVEKVREEEGMEPIEDVLSRRVALNQIDDVMETFGLSSEQVDDYMENSARDIDSMALDQITQAAGMDSEFLEYKKSLKTGDAISPIYQGRMRESQKKVFDAAMGDYWNFLARSNYGAYKDNKDKYDALKAKTAEERTTEDERWLKLTEDRATALYSAAAKKEAIGLKDNISQKLKSVAGVDYGKYLSATKDFNAKASALEKEHAAGKINDQQYEEKYNAAYDELEAIKRDSGVNDSTMATLNEIDDLTSKYGRTLLKDVAVKTSGFSETRSYDKWLEELEEKKRNSEDYERLWKESGAFGKAVLGGYEFTRKLGGSVFNSAMDVAGGLVRVLDAADAKGLYQGVGYDFSDQMYDKIMNMKAVTESKRFDADADSVLYNLADMTGNGFGSVVAFGLGGSAALALKAPAAAGTFVTGYLMAESSTYQELMDSGVVSSQEATLISNAVAPVVASIELLVPDSKVIQGYVRPAIRAAVVQGKPLLKAVDESLQTYAKSFGKEAFEEGLGYVGEVSAKNIVDAVGGYDYFNQEFSLKDLVINSLGGGLTGGLMNFFSYSSTPSPVKERAVLEMAENGQQIIDSHKNERTISDLRTTLSKPMEDLRGLKAHPNWNNLDRSKQARVFSISQQIRSLEESSVQDPIVKAQVGRLKAEQQEILSLGANGMDAKAVGVSTDKQRVFIGDQQAFFYINEDGDYEIEYNDGRSVVVSKGEGAAEKVRAMGIRADDGEVAAMNKENQNTLITPRLERGATVDYNGKNATVNSYKEKDGKVVYVNLTTEDGRTLQIREGQAGVGQELLNNLNNLPYDQKDQTRISGEVGKGQEPVTTQPVESTSEEAPATGGVLQAQEEIDSVRQRINAIEAARREGRILEDEKPNELKGLKAREKELLSQETKPSGQKLTVGSKIQWDVFGNESMNEWTVAEETTTKGGQPAVRLTRFIEQGVAEGGGVAGYTQEHIVPIADLQGKPAAEAAPQTQGQEEVIAPQATEEAAPKTEEKPTRKTRLAKLFEVSEGEEAVPAIEQALSETGIKVEVMDDAEYNEDNRIKDSQGRGSEGMFVADDGTIILNRDKIKGEWGKTIVFHEGIHPVVNIIRNTDPKRYKAIVEGLKAEAARNNDVARVAADIAASEEYQRRGPESIEDETVVETMARVATGDVNIDKFEPTFREKFIEFMNDIAKALGLRPILTNSPRVEVKRLADQINKMLNEGGKISDVVGKKNVGEFQNKITLTDTNSVFSNTSSQARFEMKFLEDSEDFTKLIEEGRVVHNASLDDINGETVVIHNPDNFSTGEIKFRGKDLVKGEGGVYFVLLYDDVWASGKKSSASQLASLINESLQKSTDGKGRLVLVKGDASKNLTSVKGAKALMGVMEILADDGLIPLSAFRKALNIAGKKYGINFDGRNDAKSIHKDIQDKFMNVSNSSFERRGDFVRDVIDAIANQNVLSKEAIAEIAESIGAKRKMTTFSKASILDSVAYATSERMLRDIPNSHVYAVIETSSKVKPEFVGKHESYPWHIVTEDGSKPILYILKDRPFYNDAFVAAKSTEKVKEGERFGDVSRAGLAQRGMGLAKVETKPTGQPSKGIKRGRNLVKDTYYEAGLTEDKNDYVFFHVSSAPKASIMKGIDSTKYTSLRTAREEKGLQYGVASYYTRPEDGERMVGGEKYAVRVPKGKVYPIDSDPMGYGEKAEENVPQGTPFRGEAVKREIADMAKKDGYQMIVGEWSYSRTGKPAGEIPEFRADALVPLKPTAEKPTSFTSNAEKGMERIPFPSQQSEQAKQELENIASEVRDIMSSKKKFSSKEYQLADSVYMSGQVTENKYEDNEFKRDITPEEYDMMTKVLPKNMQEDAARVRGLLFGGKKKGQASKGIPRTSKEFAGNVGETIDRIKAATSEDGATLNLDGTTYEDGGLVVPAGSLNVAQDEVTAEGLFDFLKDNEENISSDIFKIGLYKFPDRPEVSYDLNIVIPREYRDVALKFGELSGQESLFDLDTFENIKTGSDGKNPRKFTAQELAEIAKDLSEGRLPKIVGGKGQPSMMKRTPALASVESTAKALGGMKDDAENIFSKYKIQGYGSRFTYPNKINISRISDLEYLKEWVKGVNPNLDIDFEKNDPEYRSIADKQIDWNIKELSSILSNAKNKGYIIGKRVINTDGTPIDIKNIGHSFSVDDSNLPSFGNSDKLKTKTTVKIPFEAINLEATTDRFAYYGNSEYEIVVKPNEKLELLKYEEVDRSNRYASKPITEKEISSGFYRIEKQVSEAYHKAKADGSNPELVKAVEDLIGKPKQGQPSRLKRTPAQIRQAVEDGVDAVEAAIAESMDPQQAVDENISNQEWYGDLSAAQKEQLNEILQDEFGASVREKNAVNDKARAVSDLWAEGSRESKKRITDILEDEPELSYIYANYPKILKQLESAGLITKTDGCP